MASRSIASRAGRPSATRQYVHAASRRGVGPLTVVVALAVAVVVGTVATVLISNPPTLEWVAAEADRLGGEAAVLRDAGKLDAAVATYEKAVTLAESRRELKSQGIYLRAERDEAKRLQAARGKSSR